MASPLGPPDHTKRLGWALPLAKLPSAYPPHLQSALLAANPAPCSPASQPASPTPARPHSHRATWEMERTMRAVSPRQRPGWPPSSGALPVRWRRARAPQRWAP
jgi:hypothetical protein